MAKKKVAKKKGAKKKAANKTAALGRFGGVDLADVLHEEGVNEQRIPEALAFIRTLSDAQADDTSTPRVPTPARVASRAEVMLAASAASIVEEAERCQARTRQAIQRRASNIQGRRDTFWDLEVAVQGRRVQVSWAARFM